MKSYSEKLRIIAKNTDAYLKRFFLRQTKNSKLFKAMKYGHFSGGKRFRSSILINTGKIFKIDYKKLIIVASAVECVHSYSLIHDDLPAMDNDNLRRGKLSTHKKFNEYTAILAGNSLLTLAFEILCQRDLLIPERRKIELIKSLSNCSGHLGLAGGQYSDLAFEKKNISRKKIIKMQKKKTGNLFGFCCESVAIINGENKKIRNSLKDIGVSIGLLFQVVDDLIDFKGESSVVGKPTKSDKVKGKANLVNLFGYEKSLIFAKNLKKNIRQKIIKYGKKGNDLLESVDFILDRNF
tara:strand:+ start:150 stop:1034 length:885 start_codon:yes stop_codon:yes gene_type:complete